VIVLHSIIIIIIIITDLYSAFRSEDTEALVVCPRLLTVSDSVFFCLILHVAPAMSST